MRDGTASGSQLLWDQQQSGTLQIAGVLFTGCAIAVGTVRAMQLFAFNERLLIGRPRLFFGGLVSGLWCQIFDVPSRWILGRGAGLPPGEGGHPVHHRAEQGAYRGGYPGQGVHDVLPSHGKGKEAIMQGVSMAVM